MRIASFAGDEDMSGCSTSRRSSLKQARESRGAAIIGSVAAYASVIERQHQPDAIRQLDDKVRIAGVGETPNDREAFAGMRMVRNCVDDLKRLLLGIRPSSTIASCWV